MAKRQFTIDIGTEQIPVEGHVHKNVAVKYLMKRRRSVLMTKNPEKVEKLCGSEKLQDHDVRFTCKEITLILKKKKSTAGVNPS